MRIQALSLLALSCLTACGSAPTAGGGGAATRAVVPTDGYETYVTQHNGFTRVRRTDAQPGDAAILAQFEDSNPASPAGFRNLIDLRRTPVAGRVQAEIIGQERSWLNGNDEQMTALERVLRLTTDVERFTPEAVAAAGGEIVLSGSDYSIARIGDGDPDFANQSDPGSLYLALNFDNETAAIRILNRTLYHHCGGCTPEDLFRVDLLGENLAFNVETGAFGGDIEGELYQLFVRMGGVSVPVSGTILGQLGGSRPDDLVAGGVFQASGSGTAMGRPVNASVEGVFWGSN